MEADLLPPLDICIPEEEITANHWKVLYYFARYQARTDNEIEIQKILKEYLSDRYEIGEAFEDEYGHYFYRVGYLLNRVFYLGVNKVTDEISLLIRDTRYPFDILQPINNQIPFLGNYN